MVQRQWTTACAFLAWCGGGFKGEGERPTGDDVPLLVAQPLTRQLRPARGVNRWAVKGLDRPRWWGGRATKPRPDRNRPKDGVRARARFSRVYYYRKYVAAGILTRRAVCARRRRRYCRKIIRIKKKNKNKTKPDGAPSVSIVSLCRRHREQQQQQQQEPPRVVSRAIRRAHTRTRTRTTTDRRRPPTCTCTRYFRYLFFFHRRRVVYAGPTAPGARTHTYAHLSLGHPRVRRRRRDLLPATQ